MRLSTASGEERRALLLVWLKTGTDIQFILSVVPRRKFVSRLVQKTLVVRVYLPRWEVQGKLQGHQNAELEIEQVLSIQPEATLEFLNEGAHFVAFDVVKLGRQHQTCSGTQLAVLLVNQQLKDEFLKENISLGHCQQVNAALSTSNFAHFTLQTSQFTEGELDVWELAAKLVVQLFLQV